MSDQAQGRTKRDYTQAQAEAVNRVKRCKPTDYYGVLDIEITATETEIKKAYRKLALIMHPDKNGAPGADEAFKMVSKSFQILSDPQKKRVFDQTGSDPDSRGGGMGSSSGSGMGGHPFAGGADISPEDIFNMFFNGAAAGGPTFHQFGSGIGVQFGGPGMGMNGFPRRQAGDRRAGAAPAGEMSLLNMLPLILLLLMSITSSFFSGTGSGGSGPFGRSVNAHFEYTPKQPYVAERQTPTYGIRYYVNPAEVKDYSVKNFNQLSKKVEVQHIRTLRHMCDREFTYKQEQIQDSKGWFSVDQEKLRKAEAIPLQHCEELENLGIPYHPNDY